MKKIQQITLKMSQEIVDFCLKNQLLCYFCGGGAIGTVREQGFIPWDDDLDFFMPRE
ncbi:LicD family protein, partial [Enterococcus faecium]|nr:LicD family protein [Enterococcus faecium]